MHKKIVIILFVPLACLILLGAAFADVDQQTSKANNTAPLQLAGLLDKLLDPESKESKMLSGAVSLLGSASEIDYKSERTIGESLALEGFRRYGMPVKDKTLQEYVNLVGNAVARNSGRPNIPYNFVVVDSPLQNAFSCPGGIIFVSSGLLKTIQSEDQLAGILAHEVAHVGHKHALKSIQRAQFFNGVGKITSATMEGKKGKEFENMIGGLQDTLFDKGLDQNMEFEADTSAMDTAYRTGYDPNGLVQVLKELKRIQSKSTQKGSWFSTHPPLGQRIQNCQDQLRRYPDAKTLAHLPDRFHQYQKRIPN
ncbi:MAG: M48 family metalloprotease [Deltaproteobacteria bacterium]|jgi:beta-barrel assembly-enhancing protease|nr:M48 family metalloprotease [Deltaproteobacteria bacterium]